MRLIEILYNVFEDAETGGNLIFVFEKNKEETQRNTNIVNVMRVYEPNTDLSKLSFYGIDQSNFLIPDEFKFSFYEIELDKIIKKIENNNEKLDTYCYVNNGVNTGNVSKILLSKEKKGPLYKKILEGKDINRYQLHWNGLWINYDPSLKDTIDLDKLETRQKKIDFALRNEELFNTEKIIIRQTADKPIGTFDNNKYITRHSTHVIRIKKPEVKIKFILSLLNSKLFTFYYRNLIPEKGKVFPEVKGFNVKKLPIKIISHSDQEKFINEILKFNNELLLEVNSFKNWLMDVYNIEKLSQKLENYYRLYPKELLEELKKKKVNIKSRKEYIPLIEGRNDSLKIISPLLKQIKETDNKIDQMVYDMYGLTNEEIHIIENNI
jgi:hypothetical protein